MQLLLGCAYAPEVRLMLDVAPAQMVRVVNG
jgi:hypothetical protein